MAPAGVVVPCPSAATGDAIGRAAVPAARWRKVRRGSFMASSPCIKGTSALLYRILLSGYLSRSAKGGCLLLALLRHREMILRMSACRAQPDLRRRWSEDRI